MMRTLAKNRATLTQYLIETAPQSSGGDRRVQRPHPGGRAGVQGHRARGRARRARAASATTSATSTCRARSQKALDVIANDIFMRTTEWAGVLSGRGLRGDGRASRASRPSTRAASTCWSSTRSTARATSTSTSSVGSIFSILRAPKPGDDPHDGRLPAAGHRAGRGGLRHLRAVDDARADGRPAASSGFTLDPGTRRLPAHASGHPRARLERASSPSTRRNSRFWEAPVKRYVEECLAGADRPARQGLQHALDRLARGRDAPHPHARRRLPLPARHARTRARPVGCGCSTSATPSA